MLSKPKAHTVLAPECLTLLVPAWFFAIQLVRGLGRLSILFRIPREG